MPPLPNHHLAVVEPSKVVDYALNPLSERGRHKAQVFESALGFEGSNWCQLREATLGALPNHEATFTGETPFGRKYEVALPITGPNGRTAEVMTVWQFDRLPDGTFAEAPRLVTLYIV